MPTYEFRRMSPSMALIEARDFATSWQAVTHARALSRSGGGDPIVVSEGETVIDTVVALPGEID